MALWPRRAGVAEGDSSFGVPLDVDGGTKQPESTCSQMQQILRARQLRAAQKALYEKNAIFSAWLMRRIGASGSLAAVTGFLSMPLAMRLEPSDISTAGAGAGAGAGGGGGA